MVRLAHWVAHQDDSLAVDGLEVDFLAVNFLVVHILPVDSLVVGGLVVHFLVVEGLRVDFLVVHILPVGSLVVGGLVLVVEEVGVDILAVDFPMRIGLAQDSLEERFQPEGDRDDADSVPEIL